MRRNDGFTLLELAIVLAATALIAGAVVPSFIKSAFVDAARRAALEVSQVQEASRAYYVKKKAWPVDIAALKIEGYLDPAWSGINPFGKPYILEQSGEVMLVKTEVKNEVAGVLLGTLPMSALNAGSVVSGVTVPGIDTANLPVGAVMAWPVMDIPAGWLVCDGRRVDRREHAELFALLGVNYGAGDGATTFNIPDLRGRAVVGLDNMGGSVANVIMGSWARKIGEKWGEETHVLTTMEMPSHTHPYLETPWQGGRYDGHSSPVMTGQQWSTTFPAGGGKAHNNIQPSIALNWIIKG
ncbi:MAG: tail fiber protein [Candidatus Omnitrophica bacterium]|nr:tail fiber protein [Candidatus Omnitrophota bacterium]